MQYRYYFLICAIVVVAVHAQMHASRMHTSPMHTSSKPPFQTQQHPWAADTIQKMSLREKLGQLFIVAVSCDAQGHETLASSNKALQSMNMHQSSVQQEIEQHHLGGIIFLRKQTVEQQVALTNKLQSASKLPLLVVEDLEWGLSMRIDGALRFPRNLTLGALNNEQLVYEMGKEVGRECKAIGVHMNLAPVVDINSNPANPVINDRSFGCDKEKVARLGTLFMQGLQDAGVLACAKHFPGHGDTAVDSHVALPTIAHTKKRLFSEELSPFTKLIDAGVSGIMSGHLRVTALDAKNISTTSHAMLTDLLRTKMGFTGLVVTDALNMGALKGYQHGELELKALLAGNDILLMSVDVPQAIDYLVAAVTDGRLSESMIDEKVLKVLQAKEYLQLHKKRMVDAKNICTKITTPAARKLKKELYADAVTLLSDADSQLISPAKYSSIVQIGGKRNSRFIETLAAERSAPITYLAALLKPEDAKRYAESFQQGDTVVVALFDMQKLLHKNFGISAGTRKFVQQLQQRGVNVVLVLFGSPYSVKLFPGIGTIIAAYEDDPDAQYAAAQVVLGKQEARGMLPVC